MYCPTTPEQGAAIFRSLVHGHVFKDGNKSTGVAFWKEFIQVHEIRCTLQDRELLDIAQKVAEENLSDTSHIAEVLLIMNSIT